MNKIIKVFKYAGFSLLAIGIFSVGNHLFKSLNDFKNEKLSFYVVDIDAKTSTITLPDAEFKNVNIGIYQFKPTFTQAILLSNNSIASDMANGIFFIVLGLAILFIAQNKPQVLEDLKEDKLWQFVGAGTILFFVLKFASLHLVKEYVSDLTHHKFEYSKLNDASFGMAILALITILTVFYDLLSYSRKLKQENDLTI